MNRAARAAWPALTFLVATAVALLAAGGIGEGIDGLAAGRIVVRLIVDASAAVVLGTCVVVVLVLPSAHPGRGRLLDVAAGAAATWAVAAGTTLFLLYLGGAPAPGDPSFGPGLLTFATDVAAGRTWSLTAVLAAVLTAALLAVRSRAGIAVLGVIAGGALVPLALNDVSSGDPLALGRAVFAAQLVQLVAGAAWLGLIALGVVLDAPHAAVRRLTGIARGCGAAAALGALLGAAPRLQEGASPVLVAWGIVLVLLPLVLTPAAGARRGGGPLRFGLLVLGAGAGLTAAVDVAQRLDASLPARTSPAAILTGAPLPVPLSVASSVLTLRTDALWLVVCAVLLAGYLAGIVAIRRRGGSWPAGRLLAWVLGVVVLAWLTCGGPAEYQEVLLSAHLAQHAALLLPVPLLLAAGAPGRLLEPSGPRTAEIPSVRAAVRSTLGSAPARYLRRPGPAVVLTVVVLGALYGTGLLAWSLTDPVGAECSIAACLITGGLLVRALSAPPRRTAVIAAVLVLVLQTAVAALLALAAGLLHAEWFGAMGWGTDALIDQRTGVVIAWALLVVPTAVLLVASLRRGRERLEGRTPSPIRDRPQEEVPA
jgi:cytochrome c oxidase assembly factor CtaG